MSGETGGGKIVGIAMPTENVLPTHVAVVVMIITV